MARHPRTLEAEGPPRLFGERQPFRGRRSQAAGYKFLDYNHGKLRFQEPGIEGGCQRDLAALMHNLTYCRSVALTQAEEGQNEHDHHNQPDQINDLVHGASNSPVRLVCDVWVDRHYSQNGSTVKRPT
jgi:hypothetical protein